jgi:hypothetical protein
MTTDDKQLILFSRRRFKLITTKNLKFGELPLWQPFNHRCRNKLLVKLSKTLAVTLDGASLGFIPEDTCFATMPIIGMDYQNHFFGKVKILHYQYSVSEVTSITAWSYVYKRIVDIAECNIDDIPLVFGDIKVGQLFKSASNSRCVYKKLKLSFSDTCYAMETKSNTLYTMSDSDPVFPIEKD